jgi:hypothetical protein
MGMELGHTQVLSPPRRGAAEGSVMMLPTPQPIPNPPKSGCGILSVYQTRTKSVPKVSHMPFTAHDVLEFVIVIGVAILVINLVVGWGQDHINFK